MNVGLKMRSPAVLKVRHGIAYLMLCQLGIYAHIYIFPGDGRRQYRPSYLSGTAIHPGTDQMSKEIVKVRRPKVSDLPKTKDTTSEEKARGFASTFFKIKDPATEEATQADSTDIVIKSSFMPVVKKKRRFVVNPSRPKPAPRPRTAILRGGNSSRDMERMAQMDTGRGRVNPFAVSRAKNWLQKYKNKSENYDAEDSTASQAPVSLKLSFAYFHLLGNFSYISILSIRCSCRTVHTRWVRSSGPHYQVTDTSELSKSEVTVSGRASPKSLVSVWTMLTPQT